MTELLHRLGAAAAGLALPASKAELRAALADQPADLRQLVDTMPGLEYLFVSDLLATARIALEMDILTPWPEHLDTPGGYIEGEALAAAVRARLRLCPRVNGHLIKVVVSDGKIKLTGRAPDVPHGVMATRAALAVVPPDRLLNELHVTT